MKYRVVKRINPLNTDEKKFYAAPQYMEELTVMDLVKDISDACTLNVTDVEAVLTSLVRKLPGIIPSCTLNNFGIIPLRTLNKKKKRIAYFVLKQNTNYEQQVISVL